ncbi:MAG: chemotaxis protein CheW [Desulforhopalus sp.]
MAQEQLFASFLLDKSQGLEIALRAESVSEATPINGTIRQLPASLDFVEGIMHLRDDVIPIINLKKRLGLVEQKYAKGAMVAVVKLFHRNYGLLFDDINEVFAASVTDIQKVDGALQTEDKIISALIQREKGVRTIELLDLNNLFIGHSPGLQKVGETLPQGEPHDQKEKTYVRYVVFNFAGQSFGLPVECTQEITFFEALKPTYQKEDDKEKRPVSGSLEDIFSHGDIDGTLTLRGRTIPVLHAGRILSGVSPSTDENIGEDTRIVVLTKDGCSVGVVVEAVTTIEAIPEDEILSMGLCRNASVTGVYQKAEGQNIMLLNMESLVCDRMDELKAMGRLACEVETAKNETGSPVTGSNHVLTENCYLVFGIGRNMALQLKDVQEIIERAGVMGIPGGSGVSRGVINLRGAVVPVLNLREFYGYKKGTSSPVEQKLIICRTESRVVALEVDNIVTIYKQEQYQNTASLRPDLTKKEDTLDRLIVFDGGTGKKEHVLVVNIDNLIRNHLDMAAT